MDIDTRLGAWSRRTAGKAVALDGAGMGRRRARTGADNSERKRANEF